MFRVSDEEVARPLMWPEKANNLRLDLLDARAEIRALREQILFGEDKREASSALS